MTPGLLDELDEETEMFGAGQADDPDAEPAAPERRGRPGPPPNPNSKRQRKIRAAEARRAMAAAPAKKATPNKPSAAGDMTAVYQRGAKTILGWIMQPLGAGGLALGMAAKMPRVPPARKAGLLAHGQALTLDMLTLKLHSDALTTAAADAAPNIPWLARALSSAAKVGPYAELAGVGAAIVFQVLTNHGLLPPMEELGTMAPEELAMAAGVPMDEPAE